MTLGERDAPSQDQLRAAVKSSHRPTSKPKHVRPCPKSLSCIRGANFAPVCFCKQLVVKITLSRPSVLLACSWRE